MLRKCRLEIGCRSVQCSQGEDVRQRDTRKKFQVFAALLAQEELGDECGRTACHWELVNRLFS